MLAALNVARRLYRGELTSLPTDAPVSFVDADLRAPVKNAEGPSGNTPGKLSWALSAGSSAVGRFVLGRRAATTDTSGT